MVQILMNVQKGGTDAITTVLIMLAVLNAHVEQDFSPEVLIPMDV